MNEASINANEIQRIKLVEMLFSDIQFPQSVLERILDQFRNRVVNLKIFSSVRGALKALTILNSTYFKQK